MRLLALSWDLWTGSEIIGIGRVTEPFIVDREEIRCTVCCLSQVG